MKVSGVIRKLGVNLVAETNKTHVLFVKKDNKTVSFLVDEYIIEGEMTDEQDYENVNESFEDIEINGNASGITRNASREFKVEDTVANLLSKVDLSVTYTPGHNATYNA
jgi:hypothetical protein